MYIMLNSPWERAGKPRESNFSSYINFPDFPFLKNALPLLSRIDLI